MEAISIQDYAKIVGYKGEYPNSLVQVQDYAEEFLDVTLWDYPLDEIEDTESEYVIVTDEFGEDRVCELP